MIPANASAVGSLNAVPVASTGYTTPLTFTYKIAETPAPAEVDTTALEAAIAEADNLKEADYTVDAAEAEIKRLDALLSTGNADSEIAKLNEQKSATLSEDGGYLVKRALELNKETDAGNFKLGGYLVGLVLLVLIIAGMCFEERFFCRNFCPMGAVFSLLPVLPFFALHRDRENCIKGCKACTKKCPSNIGLPEDGSPKVEGDCFQCQKCIDTCPKGNIHTGVKGLCGNEFWFTILRAVILLMLLLWLGV